jgi:hypothetical protein
VGVGVGVKRPQVRVSGFWVVEVVEADGGDGDGDDDGGGGVRVRVSGELQCTPDHKRGGGLGTVGGQVRCGRQRRRGGVVALSAGQGRMAGDRRRGCEEAFRVRKGGLEGGNGVWAGGVAVRKPTARVEDEGVGWGLPRCKKKKNIGGRKMKFSEPVVGRKFTCLYIFWKPYRTHEPNTPTTHVRAARTCALTTGLRLRHGLDDNFFPKICHFSTLSITSHEIHQKTCLEQ